MRSSMIGDKMDGGSIQKLLNDKASAGWQLKSNVKGGVGPGGTDGLMLIFERQRPQ